jgi:hypothetical protein
MQFYGDIGMQARELIVSQLAELATGEIVRRLGGLCREPEE